jgi:hypothetical protein
MRPRRDRHPYYWKALNPSLLRPSYVAPVFVVLAAGTPPRATVTAFPGRTTTSNGVQIAGKVTSKSIYLTM